MSTYPKFSSDRRGNAMSTTERQMAADAVALSKEHADRARRAEDKLAAIAAYLQEQAEEVSERLFHVRPNDIRVAAGPIVDIIEGNYGP